MPVKASTAAARTRLYRDAVAHVRDNYENPDLDLADCARAIGTSRRALQRALNENGTTWRKMLTGHRMEVAASLLEEGTPSVQVAARVGYQQPAQFAKAFRRVYGIAPSEYRRGVRPRTDKLAA